MVRQAPHERFCPDFLFALSLSKGERYFGIVILAPERKAYFFFSFILCFLWFLWLMIPL